MFKTQQSERYLAFSESYDPQTVADFPDVEVDSMICVPLSSAQSDLGCIQFVNKEGGGRFTDAEADVCEMMAMLAAMPVDENEKLQPEWEPGNAIMHVRGVTREFRNGDVVTRVLKGVNLDVYEGEFLVLLGESGCGKSTLLNIIGGMDHS